jgi:hypothetical protein
MKTLRTSAAPWTSTLVFAACLSLPLLAFRALGGCLDFTPIPAPVADLDAGAVESGPDGAPVQTACLTCAGADDDAGGCAAELAQCNGIDPCRTTVACVVGQCFNPTANILDCLGACEADGGITASSGAESAAFAAFLQCMSVHCQSVCLP